MISTLCLLAALAASPSAPPTLTDLLQGASAVGREAAHLARLEVWVGDGWQASRDAFGTLIVARGDLDACRRVVAVGVDEEGYVVSRIRPDGYLRLHYVGTTRAPTRFHEMHEGRPVRVQTRDGEVAGVILVDSLHLRGERPARVEERHLWLDVGADSESEARALGIRLLDPVTAREFSVHGDTVSGPSVGRRAACFALVWLMQQRAAVWPADTAVAFVAQSLPGRPPLGRGFEGVTRRLSPEEIVVVQARELAEPRVRVRRPRVRRGPPTVFVDLPVRHARTPVETVKLTGIAALIAELGQLVLSEELEPPRLPAPSPGVHRQTDASARVGHEESAATLAALVAMSGVSGHEKGVADTLRFLTRFGPIRLEEDAAGNLTATIGKGERSLAFVAHMDEVGFETAGLADDGRARLRSRGGFYPYLYSETALEVVTGRGVFSGIGLRADGQHFFSLGLSRDAMEEIGVTSGQPVTVTKEFLRLGHHRAAGRSFDDRVGCAALLLALEQLDPTRLDRRVVFAWVTREEIGLEGADALARRLRPIPEVVFPIDTFVSSDSPRDDPRFAYARLGGGPVLRALDNSSITPLPVLDRVRAIARAHDIPLQIGVVGGGNDGSRFVPEGSLDCPLSWPQRCSHSRVETMDLRDLESLASLIAHLAREY